MGALDELRRLRAEVDAIPLTLDSGPPVGVRWRMLATYQTAVHDALPALLDVAEAAWDVELQRGRGDGLTVPTSRTAMNRLRDVLARLYGGGPNA